MRLVIDGRRLTAGRTGVGRYLEDLLAEWAITGPPRPETLVVLADPAGLDRVPRPAGLRAKVVGAGWPGLIWERWGLGRILRPGDLLFAPTNLVPGNWRGPTVLVVFDLLQEVRPEDFPWHVRWRFRGRYRRSARRADRLIVPSHATAADLARFSGIPADRIRVIHPGIGPEFRPSPVEAAEARRSLGLGAAPFFLFVGKVSARRHWRQVLEGFERHREVHRDHRLVVVGPGSAAKLGGITRSTGTIVPGFVPEPTLRGLMSGALALLYPSEYEGFGLPVVEAMACGCPVVTLRNSALVESGGDAAWYADAPTADHLARAMHRLTVEPALRAALVARGLAHAAHFGRAGFAEAVKAELIAASRPSSI